jgi:hypothetical protein
MSERLGQLLSRLTADDFAGLFAFVSFSVSLYEPIRFWSALIAVVAGIVWFALVLRERGRAKRRQNRVRQLTAEIEMAANPMDMVYDIGERLQLNNNWRLTLYRVQDRRWTRLGRLSDRDEFDGFSGGRECIDFEEGVLGSAARQGGLNRQPGAFEESGIAPCRKADPAGWLAFQRDWGLADSTAQTLRMPTRKYEVVVMRVPLGPGKDVTYGAVLEVIGEAGPTKIQMQAVFDRAFFIGLHKMLSISPAVKQVLEVVS